MKVLSHRGLWRSSSAKNTPEAFKRSFDAGFGTETDIRDLSGSLVISHDPPTVDAPKAETLLEALNGRDLTLALNVKSDGLQALVAKLVDSHHLKNYFLFDMSVPDMPGYFNQGLTVFTRHSDIEPVPAFYADAHGVWLDTLEAEWITDAVIEDHLAKGKQVCVVSPELHKRPHQGSWANLRDWDNNSIQDIMICTDLAVDANAFFNKRVL